jgi:Glycosyl transferases group 1/Glycosyl transferase 4-like
MANSVHTARWIRQVANLGWDLHLFPVERASLHPDLRNVTVHEFLYHTRRGPHESVPVVGGWPLPRGSYSAERAVQRWSPALADRAQRLARTIRRLRPDVLHTMEIQHASYLALDARPYVPEGEFPPWLVSNWGSDIYLFGRLPSHAERIRRVMGTCDYYHCECHRDVALGHDFGFRGETMPIFPVTGGFEVKAMQSLRPPGPTSSRRRIALKGFQNWAGRALVGLQAIEMCADALKGYSVSIYMTTPDVRLAAELVAEKTGIPFEVESHELARDDILRMHGSARVSIGLNISDAISTSLLEAMIMGSFPVQSNTGCGDEWIACGENGLLVPPESPEAVAAALRRALTDDVLVDRAAETNARLTAERLDVSVVTPQAIRIYEKIAAQGRCATARPPAEGER